MDAVPTSFAFTIGERHFTIPVEITQHQLDWSSNWINHICGIARRFTTKQVANSLAKSESYEQSLAGLAPVRSREDLLKLVGCTYDTRPDVSLNSKQDGTFAQQDEDEFANEVVETWRKGCSEKNVPLHLTQIVTKNFFGQETFIIDYLSIGNDFSERKNWEIAARALASVQELCSEFSLSLKKNRLSIVECLDIGEFYTGMSPLLKDKVVDSAVNFVGSPGRFASNENLIFLLPAARIIQNEQGQPNALASFDDEMRVMRHEVAHFIDIFSSPVTGIEGWAEAYNYHYDAKTIFEERVIEVFNYNKIISPEVIYTLLYSHMDSVSKVESYGIIGAFYCYIKEQLGAKTLLKMHQAIYTNWNKHPEVFREAVIESLKNNPQVVEEFCIFANQILSPHANSRSWDKPAERIAWPSE